MSKNLLKPMALAADFFGDEVADVALARGVSKFWRDRIARMASRAALFSGNLNGDHWALGFSRIRVTRKNWPLGGSIRLLRHDGKEFVLRMKGKKFLVEEK